MIVLGYTVNGTGMQRAKVLILKIYLNPSKYEDSSLRSLQKYNKK